MYKAKFLRSLRDKYQRCIDILLGAKSIEVLYNIHSLNYEILRGDKADISSIRVNKQYRIEFTVKDNGIEPAYPTHPGEVLKEELEYRGISQRKFAARIRYTMQTAKKDKSFAKRLEQIRKVAAVL